MHQSHNIPWDIISNHFKFIYQDKRFTPPRSGLYPKNTNDQRTISDLKHFIRKFAAAITTFSETERAKYPEKVPPPGSDALLFSDELRDRYPEYLSAENQKIEMWIRKARSPHYYGKYTTSNADLAETVKILLAENELSTLITLAQHPDIPLGDLDMLSWGHHFGFSRVKESALGAYLFINSMEAVGMLGNGRYTEADGYYGLLRGLTMSMDYPAQQLPHKEFLLAAGVLVDDDRRDRLSDKLSIHNDYELLKEYLKKLFTLLYRYDLLIRECGKDPEWEANLTHYIPIAGVINLESRWIEAENRWESFIP